MQERQAQAEGQQEQQALQAPQEPQRRLEQMGKFNIITVALQWGGQLIFGIMTLLIRLG